MPPKEIPNPFERICGTEGASMTLVDGSSAMRIVILISVTSKGEAPHPFPSPFERLYDAERASGLPEMAPLEMRIVILGNES